MLAVQASVPIRFVVVVVEFVTTFVREQEGLVPDLNRGWSSQA